MHSHEWPNQRLHANAAIALLFHFGHHWRGVGDPYRSPEELLFRSKHVNARRSEPGAAARSVKSAPEKSRSKGETTNNY